MEERSKTIMCSVLFLDIVEYSKMSVSGQISLKERFNAFLSVAIRDVPMDDRIILDTGDGAALSFLGDVEDALQVALSMRESLRSQGAQLEPPLLVRMGINIGPVRLVKDINGQPNIVGDGINVAQRIMAFSDPGQILVSRSYYDAVSRLSPEYGGMFHYQGSRTDKHVREHEIYAIGYPGEFTSKQEAINVPKLSEKLGALMQQLGKAWQAGASQLGVGIQAVAGFFRKATPRQRAMYGGSMAAIVAVVFLVEMLAHHGTATKPRVADETVARQEQPAAKPDSTAKAPEAPAKPHAAPEKKTVNAKPVPDKSKKTIDKKPAKPSDKSASKPKAKPRTNLFGIPLGKKLAPGFVSVTCMEGSSVFVDGFSKGIVGNSPLSIPLDPGKHQLTITHTSKASVYSELITVKSGETIRLKPGFCD